MPLGITRLVLSTSAIRRVFAGGEIALEYLTTQDDRTLQDQNLRFIAVEQSSIETDQIVEIFDPLITQDGQFFQLNQSNQLLVLEQDFETSGDTFISQAGVVLVTQDNRAILTQREG